MIGRPTQHASMLPNIQRHAPFPSPKVTLCEDDPNGVKSVATGKSAM